MKIEYKRRVAKDLIKLAKSERRKIVKKFHVIKNNPLAGKPLQGEYKGLFAAKSWPYRIIYKIETDRVIVYKVAHRRAAYK